MNKPLSDWIEKIKMGFPVFLFTVLLSTITFIFNLSGSNISHDMTFISWIYYIFSALGHAFTFSLVLYFIYALIVGAIRNVKISLFLYCLFGALLQLLFVLDGIVFNIYRFHINGFVLDLAFGAGSDVFVFSAGLYLKFFLMVTVVAILPYFIIYKLVPRLYSFFRKKSIIVISLSLVLCLLVAHIGHAFASAFRYMSVGQSATVLPYFFPLTANSLMKKLGVTVDDEIEGVSFNISSATLNYPLHPLEVSDSIPKYNILHIVIDAWNPSTFDSIVSPNIYKFSQNNLFYSNHFSSHCGTNGGLFGMFFGLPYSYQNDFEIAQRSPLFIDRLVEENYNIQVFPSATFEKPPFNKRIFRRVPDIHTKTPGQTPFDRDNKITEMALSYLDEQDKQKPFYAFLFYDLPHAISIPEEYRQKFQPSWADPNYLELNNDLDRTPFFNLYKNCVYHTDKLIGSVLERAEQLGLLDNTIIIITSDHGQEFNENKKNYWGHTSNFSDWQLKVPLILHILHLKESRKYSHMTTHYDLTVTLLSRYFGIRNTPSDYSMGFDLDSTDTRYPLMVGDYVRFGFVFEDMIVSTNRVGAISLTDRHLNNISRDKLDVNKLNKAIEKKNRFYNK